MKRKAEDNENLRENKKTKIKDSHDVYFINNMFVSDSTDEKFKLLIGNANNYNALCILKNFVNMKFNINFNNMNIDTNKFIEIILLTRYGLLNVDDKLFLKKNILPQFLFMNSEPIENIMRN